MSETSRPSRAAKVFYSYAHEDEGLRDELAKHLKPLERQGLIEPWHDRQITPGTDWHEDIDHHLNSADVILLLVSADMAASDYCYGIEVKRAMERHHDGEARVIPIILRSCNWQSAPFGKLQALPKNGVAATTITTWPTLDEAFTDVARGVALAVLALTPRPAMHGEEATGTPPETGHSSREVGGDDPQLEHNLPAQTTRFIGRAAELVAARELLMDQHVRLVTLTGTGGTGKTRLGLAVAAAVANQIEDGVYFVDLTSVGDPDLVVSSISQTLRPNWTDNGTPPLVEALKQFLRHKRLLLVLDNFEQVMKAAPVVGQLLRAAPGLRSLAGITIHDGAVRGSSV